MASATTTIRQTLNHKPEQGAWFAANQALFNRVVAFYFDMISSHEKVLELGNQEALRTLEQLTHTTKNIPSPVMPLSDMREDIPAMFRRAAINTALGSARSFYSHLRKWRKRKEKAEAKGKKFHERPPVPPRTWNKSALLYAGMWKDRSGSSLMIKVWTGTCWSWIKVRITGRELPANVEIGSPSLIRKGAHWWIHTPIEKRFTSPGKIEKQVSSKAQTRICAIDLNLDGHLAVCTVQAVEGSILATTFIGGGQRVHGFRKHQLGRIARNRCKTGIIAENEHDNTHLWEKIRNVDEHVAHLVSHRIVQFAQQHEATILVFEHLVNLKPEKGKYSKRGNEKRTYWMKGRIFKYAKYKAYNAGILTSRVSPRNTSRECARCHSLVARYAEGQPAEGYATGAPLVLCPNCKMRSHADRNASLVIGQRLIARYQKPLQKQGKPLTPLATEREPKGSGVVVPQDAKSRKKPSISQMWHGDSNGPGTAQEGTLWMEERPSSMPTQLRLFTQ